MEINETLLIQVWQKGHIVDGRDDTDYRNDDYGNLMYFRHHGNRDSSLGWEIDHIVAKADRGRDDLSNLRPLHWRANVARN